MIMCLSCDDDAGSTIYSAGVADRDTQSSLPSGSATVTQVCGPCRPACSTFAPRATRPATTWSTSSAPMRRSRCSRFFTVLGSGTSWNSTRGARSVPSGWLIAAPSRQTSLPLCDVVSPSSAYPSLIIRRMKSASCGSTCQPSVSAHQSASVCGSAQSTVTWNSYATAVVPSRGLRRGHGSGHRGHSASWTRGLACPWTGLPVDWGGSGGALPGDRRDGLLAEVRGRRGQGRGGGGSDGGDDGGRPGDEEAPVVHLHPGEGGQAGRDQRHQVADDDADEHQEGEGREVVDRGDPPLAAVQPQQVHRQRGADRYVHAQRLGGPVTAPDERQEVTHRPAERRPDEHYPRGEAKEVKDRVAAPGGRRARFQEQHHGGRHAEQRPGDRAAAPRRGVGRLTLVVECLAQVRARRALPGVAPIGQAVLGAGQREERAVTGGRVLGAEQVFTQVVGIAKQLLTLAVGEVGVTPGPQGHPDGLPGLQRVVRRG